MHSQPASSALKLRDVPMRLSLSASVANDLGALRKGLKDLAERLGHSSCATGCNQLHLHLEHEFTLERDALAAELKALPRIDLSPVPVAQAVRISAPAAVFDDIGMLSTAIEQVLGRLGCSNCSSGFDILFQREVDGFAFNAKLDLRGFGRFA